MKSIIADLNRRGPDGTVRVSLRRFDVAPSVGEEFIVKDGDEKFLGTVTSTTHDPKYVLMEVVWWPSSPNTNYRSTGSPMSVVQASLQQVSRPATTARASERSRKVLTNA